MIAVLPQLHPVAQVACVVVLGLVTIAGIAGIVLILRDLNS